MPIRVLLADDEPLARRRLLRFLRAEPDVEVVAECADGQAAVAALHEHAVDVALLDVQMPDLSGLEVVAAVEPARLPVVVFVTAFDEYAVRAFEVHALDYLLKPVTAARFQAAFARARAHLERASAAESGRRLKRLLAQVLADEPAAAAAAGLSGTADGAPPPAPAPRLDRVMVKSQGRVSFVRTSDVDWFEADGNYVRLHVGRASHLVRESIGALERTLDPARFARIHRGTIVNLDRIAELQPWFAGDYLVLLRDGTRLKLTRTYREQLQQRLQHTA